VNNNLTTNVRHYLAPRSHNVLDSRDILPTDVFTLYQACLMVKDKSNLRLIGRENQRHPINRFCFQLNAFAFTSRDDARAS
jgi:hypothetical protein